ncbi:hypothetical protein L208DRAFT_1412255, partial [Tricholoma matsutake]
MPLPAFKPPDAHADIPRSSSPPFPTDSTPTPVGNKLIVHNLPFDGPSAPVTTVKEAVMALLQRYPQLQKVMPVAAQRNNANYCYLKLDASISRTLIQPHPNLLHEWIQPLHEYNADWNIAWSPQKSKDRWAWVQVIGVGCNSDGSGEVTPDTKKEVVEYAISKGIAVLGSWSMPGKIGLILQTASQAQMFTISPIRICSLSRQVYAKLWNQVEIHYAFELLIPGFLHIDDSVVSRMDSYFHQQYPGAPDDPGFCSSRLEGDFYIFLMRDWETTAKVLMDHEKIAQDFKAHSLNPPMLVAAQSNEMTQISHNLASVSTILGQLSQNVTQIDYCMHAQHDETHYRILVMDSNCEIEKMEARLIWVDEGEKDAIKEKLKNMSKMRDEASEHLRAATNNVHILSTTSSAPAAPPVCPHSLRRPASTCHHLLHPLLSTK